MKKIKFFNSDLSRKRKYPATEKNNPEEQILILLYQETLSDNELFEDELWKIFLQTTKDILSFIKFSAKINKLEALGFLERKDN